MSEESVRAVADAESAAFEELWRAVRAGKSIVYRQLVQDCTPYLLEVVRRRLDRRLRPRFDSIDFTQAVWASFVARSVPLTRRNAPQEAPCEADFWS